MSKACYEPSKIMWMIMRIIIMTGNLAQAGPAFGFRNEMGDTEACEILSTNSKGMTA